MSEATGINSGKHFILMLVVVGAMAVALTGYRLGSWPWDHDEVSSLVEVGVRDRTVSGAAIAQIPSMWRLIPVWYAFQSGALRFLPHDELGTRVLPAVCGTLVVTLSFAFAWCRWGASFAVALAILMGLSEPLIWLSQNNRFYTLALLFLMITLGVFWWRTNRHGLAMGLCAVGAVLAVLTHNLLVVVFGIYFIAALAGAVLGVVPRTVAARVSVAFVAAAATYVLYLRPLLVRWVVGGTGGTNELVSFAAAAGIPTIALAFLGVAVSLRRSPARADIPWWVLVLVGSLAFIGIGSRVLGNWNPRYAVLFLAPLWILAAQGIDWLVSTTRSTGRAAAIYLFVVVLLLPKVASYYRDGSRHDLRASARVAATQVREGETVYCNWPMELDYYLNGMSKAVWVEGWSRSAPLPDRDCLVILASNVFESVLAFPDRSCEVRAEIGKRRFDEQSYWVRIYHVGPLKRGDQDTLGRSP